MAPTGACARLGAVAALLVATGCSSEPTFEEQQELRMLFQQEFASMLEASNARLHDRADEATMHLERYKERHVRSRDRVAEIQPFDGPVPDDEGLILLKQSWDALEAVFPLQVAALEAPTRREFLELAGDDRLLSLQSAYGEADGALERTWIAERAWPHKPGQEPGFQVTLDDRPPPPLERSERDVWFPPTREQEAELKQLFQNEYDTMMGAIEARTAGQHVKAAAKLRRYQTQHEHSRTRVEMLRPFDGPANEASELARQLSFARVSLDQANVAFVAMMGSIRPRIPDREGPHEGGDDNLRERDLRTRSECRGSRNRPPSTGDLLRRRRVLPA